MKITVDVCKCFIKTVTEMGETVFKPVLVMDSRTKKQAQERLSADPMDEINKGKVCDCEHHRISFEIPFAEQSQIHVKLCETMGIDADIVF